MTLKPITKSEAQRVLRSTFGSLTRIEVDEDEVRAIAEDGELIVAIELAGNLDPYRQMLSVACQLERKTAIAARAKQLALARNAMVIQENLRKLNH